MVHLLSGDAAGRWRMIDRFFSRRRIVARLESGPVRRELELFASVLREEGYAAETGRKYIRSAHRFGGWLEGIGVGIEGCHEQAIGLYIWQLGRRRHPRWDRGRLPEAAEGVRKFVSVLRQRDMMAAAAHHLKRTRRGGCTRSTAISSTWRVWQRGRESSTSAGAAGSWPCASGTARWIGVGSAPRI